MSLALNKARCRTTVRMCSRRATCTTSVRARQEVGAESGAAMWVLGGWQIPGTAEPQYRTVGLADRWHPRLNAPGNADRPNWLTPVVYLGGAGPGREVLRPPLPFAIPGQNTMGNAGRNIIQGPGFVNLDAAVAPPVPDAGRHGSSLCAWRASTSAIRRTTTTRIRTAIRRSSGRSTAPSRISGSIRLV